MVKPTCLCDPAFMVLTTVGWKWFLDIQLGDRVWSRKADGFAAISKVSSIVNQPYTGPAYHTVSRYIDSIFTPDHRFLLQNCYRNDTYIAIKEIYDNQDKYGTFSLFKCGETDLVMGERAIAVKSTKRHFNLSTMPTTTLDKRFVKIERLDFVGNIYCLSVDYGNFYMQQNGYSFWTGNSDPNLD